MGFRCLGPRSDFVAPDEPGSLVGQTPYERDARDGRRGESPVHASRPPRGGFNPPEVPMRRAAFVPVLLLAVAAPFAGVRPRAAIAGDDAGKAAKDKEEREKQVADLLERLRAKDVGARVGAARDARACEDSRITAALAHALSDPDAEVRKTAARVLG